MNLKTTTLVFILMGILSGCYYGKQTPLPLPDAYMQSIPYKSRETRKELKEILRSEDRYTNNKKHQMIRDSALIPEILYIIKDGEIAGHGTSIILNRTGLFLTAHHVSKYAGMTTEQDTRYTVRRGDTLSGIAEQFDVDMMQIVRDNNLTYNKKFRGYNIHPGDALSIKGTKGNVRLLGYDPVTDKLMEARIIASSEELDLALGRYEVPPGFNMETIHIEDDAINYGDEGHKFRFKHTGSLDEYAMGETYPIDEIYIDSGILIINLENRTLNRKLALNGNHYFLAARTKKGDSGGPIFSDDGELIGITSKIMVSSKYQQSSDKTLIAGREAIRAFLKTYLRD